MTYPIGGGFPNWSAPFTDSNGRLTRDGMNLLQLLFNRTGSVGGDFLTGQSVQGPPGISVVLDPDEAEEPMMRGGLIVPGGWFDEKGSGGTYGFAESVDFTPNVSTQITLSQAYGSQANLIVTFDSNFQGADQFSLSGKILTFTSAIPAGVDKVYVKGFLMPQ